MNNTSLPQRLFYCFSLLVFSYSLTGQITIIQHPADIVIECTDFENPQLNTELFNWINNYGGAEASSDCGQIVEPWDHNISEFDSSLGCQQTATVQWTINDDCGSPSQFVEAIVTIVDTEAPKLINNGGLHLPEDITAYVSNCDDKYFFPNGYFEEEISGKKWTDFPLIENVHYEDGCSGSWFQTSYPVTEFFNVGVTPVIYTISDSCDNQWTHSFDVTVICLECPNDINYCPTCPSTTSFDCFICGNADLRSGIEACMPEFNGDFEQSNQPPVLCFGAGIPNNMSWWSFIAGSEMIEVYIETSNCSDNNSGIQSGVYDGCHENGGQCIGGDGFCADATNGMSYSVGGLIPGNTYHIFIDGCNGSSCEYTLQVENIDDYSIPQPNQLSIENTFMEAGDSTIYFCTSEYLIVNLEHLGTGVESQGEFFEMAGPYHPEYGC